MQIDVSSLLCYRLFFLVKTNEHLIDLQMKQWRLSRTQWKILVRFNFLSVPCTQQQLLKSMDIDRAHLTRTLDQLEQRQLITRTRLPNDKRAFNILPTSQGKSLIKKLEKFMQQESESMSAPLTAKERKLLDMFLHKMTKKVLAELDAGHATYE